MKSSVTAAGLQQITSLCLFLRHHAHAHTHNVHTHKQSMCNEEEAEKQLSGM